MKLPPVDALDLLPDAVCIVDPEGHLLFVNASFQRILGYTSDEVIARRAFDLIHPDDVSSTLQQAELVMGGAVQRHFRNRYIHRNGHSVDIQWSAQWLPQYEVRIGIGREITELRRIERELEYRASHDPLTGLSNRHRLEICLRHAIDHAAATGGGVALLYLDLDDFKSINDQYGHGAGDRILQEVANRLRQGLRETDLVARLGGDEFAVLLPGCREEAVARTVADAIRGRLKPLFALPTGPASLNASIGIACFPADGRDSETLLSRADQSMYTTKHLGRRKDAGA